MTTIAAIIPLYNGADYIEIAIKSVLNQERSADEIIIVDDGSTDNGPALVETMAAGNPKIRLLRKKNGGQGSARNLGVATTSCDLIAFLDQDDFWYEDHLSVLEQFFLNKDDGNLAYVYSNPDRVGVNGEMLIPKLLNTLKNQEHPKTSLISCLANDMYVLPGSSLISRKIFLAVGGFDEGFRGYEDDDLFVRMFCSGYRSEYIDRSLYGWRDNPSSTSYSRTMIVSRERYFDKLLSTGLVARLPKADRAAFSHRFARLGSRDIKLAIARNDAVFVEQLLPHTMKASQEMLPFPRFLLRSKVLRRYWTFRLRLMLDSLFGIKRETSPFPMSPK